MTEQFRQYSWVLVELAVYIGDAVIGIQNVLHLVVVSFDLGLQDGSTMVTHGTGTNPAMRFFFMAASNVDAYLGFGALILA